MPAGKYHYLTLYSIDSSAVHEERPQWCPHCGYPGVVGASVLGSERDMVFWTCTHCKGGCLRYPAKDTEIELARANLTLLNPDNFEMMMRRLAE